MKEEAQEVGLVGAPEASGTEGAASGVSPLARRAVQMERAQKEEAVIVVEAVEVVAKVAAAAVVEAMVAVGVEAAVQEELMA